MEYLNLSTKASWEPEAKWVPEAENLAKAKYLKLGPEYNSGIIQR